MTLAEDLRALVAEAVATSDDEHRATFQALLNKLDGPLHVAIAGRMKAGKSTLLNALIGERIAPTDASECTRIVTWYQRSSEYVVRAELTDGATVELSFHRDPEGHLAIDLGVLQPATVRRLIVGWPSARLRDLTVIDTPGLDSTTPGTADRTISAITGHAREADAIVYLMRHAHRSDIAFLEAFHGGFAGQGTPVNSIAVLSRADEIGAGRLDALESAERIARRYAADPRLSGLVATVVSVAGLLAETSVTVEEHEAEALRRLASEEAATTEQLLLSADLFREPGSGPLTVGVRESLLARLGLFGLRYAIQTHLQGGWSSASDLARLLDERSGLPDLRSAIDGRFSARSRQLVCRSVLLGLRQLSEAGSLAPDLVHRLEELESGTHEFAELSMLDMALSGDAGFNSADRIEAERVTRPGSAAERCGCEPGAGPAQIQAAAALAVARWRERAADPLATRTASLCAETMARCYEGIYAQLLNTA